MTRFWLLKTAAATLFCCWCSLAWGNGWGSGLNHVPLVEPATAVDSAGETLALKRGTPIHVSFDEDRIETSLRWPTRPYERSVTIPRSALPEELRGFRSYHDEDFDRAAKELAAEAEASQDPLVRNWKWILAGHARLLAEPNAYDSAIAMYDRAASPADAAFADYGAYFAARATLASDCYPDTLGRLVQLRDAMGSEIEDNVLFSTYPLPNDQLAGWTVHRPTNLDRAVTALSNLVDAIDARAGLPQDAEDAAVAKAMYAEAKARENLFAALPEGFYDFPRPERAAALLLEIADKFPETDTAKRAYYDYVFTYKRAVDDPDGDPKVEEEWLRKLFLEKFPESDLLNRQTN